MPEIFEYFGNKYFIGNGDTWYDWNERPGSVCYEVTNKDTIRGLNLLRENPQVMAPLTRLQDGVKFDDNKPRYDLIPPEAMEALAKLYALGAKKYEDRNWEKGMNWGRIFRAMMSHAWAWWRGEEFDPDGQHHLDSVAWCAFALRTYVARRIGTDDRKLTNQPGPADQQRPDPPAGKMHPSSWPEAGQASNLRGGPRRD